MLAAIAGVPLLLGAAPAIVLAALAIALAARMPGVEPRRRRRRRGHDDVRRSACCWRSRRDSPPGIETLLFGDILGPTDADLLAAAALAALVAVALWLLHGRLLATGFDRGSARALGLSPALVEAALLVLLAAAIVVAVQGLGNLLVVAVFVGPAAAARQLTDRIVPMIALAAGDRRARRPRRPLPLLLRGHRRRAPRWRWRSSPPTCSRCRSGRCGAARPRARPRRRLRSSEMATATDTGWAEHALETLQAAGHRRGGARTAVVEALAGHDCAVTALDLDDELRRRRPPVGRASVYRALEQLEQLGLVQRSRSARGTAGYERIEPERPPSPPRDLPRLRPHGPLRGLLAGAGDRRALRAHELRGHRARRRPPRPLRGLLLTSLRASAVASHFSR